MCLGLVVWCYIFSVGLYYMYVLCLRLGIVWWLVSLVCFVWCVMLYVWVCLLLTIVWCPPIVSIVGRSLLVDLAPVLLCVRPPCPVLSPRGLLLGVRVLSVFWFRTKKLV
jgi:hypothetical protein